MDWLKVCTDYYNAGYYTTTSLKIFVVKAKITAEQYKAVTGIDYVA